MKQLLIFFATILGLSANAQSFTGSWEVFPNFGTPTTIVETPEYVYTLAGTSLIGYDKATEEMAAYNTSHRLNGNAVAGIWYDPDARYLFVAYTDYNIDLVYDDGRTINVPDLRDAAINTDKTINGVAFYDGKAYVGSNSGLLVVDAQYGAITESCLWGKQINLIAVTPGKLLIYYTGGDRWYVADRTASHHNFDKAFARSNKGVAYPSNQAILSAAGKIAYISNNVGYMFNVNDAAENADAITGTTKVASGIEAKNIQVTKDGFIFGGSGKAHRVNATTGEVVVKDAVADNKVAGWDNDLWLVDATGFCQYSEGAESARLKPNATSGTNVGIFRQAPDGTVYMSTLGVHHYSSLTNLAFGKIGYVDIYNQGKLTPVVTTPNKSLTEFTYNPLNEDELLISYFVNGVTIHNKQTGQTRSLDFSELGVTIAKSMILDIKVDSDGSLWCLYSEGYSTPHLIKSAPGGWLSDGNTTKLSMVNISAMGQNHSTRMVIDEAKRNIVASGGNGLSVTKMPSSESPLSSDTNMAFCSMSTDEDGNTMAGYRFPTLVMDKKGWLWIGSDAGIRVIRNTDEMFNSGFAPMRPKVPRNDGTNLADYLLDQVEIINIAVDENDEKWISTNGSGLYHVNSDGSEILEHFSTANSQIPSDMVLAAMPDKFSNKIFVGTDQGLSIYHSTTAPAKSDFKDVYAYPNPVTPDYTGYINIAGLMDGTLVKIADAAGHVFFQGKSSGGMITWNGCDSSGRRVKSGVYFVFASKTDDDQSGSAVTKIVVVN